MVAGFLLNFSPFPLITFAVNFSTYPSKFNTSSNTHHPIIKLPFGQPFYISFPHLTNILFLFPIPVIINNNSFLTYANAMAKVVKLRMRLAMINGSMMDGEEKVAKLMAWDACHRRRLMGLHGLWMY